MGVRHGKRTTTYYALIKGERINLGTTARLPTPSCAS